MKRANKPVTQSELSILSKALEDAIGLLIDKVGVDQCEDFIRLYRTKHSELIERLILTRGKPEDALAYAENFIQGRWQDFESKVMEHGMWTVVLGYACGVLNGRWRDAEQLLLDKGYIMDIVMYARDVIKGRWPECECQILGSDNDSYKETYANCVLTGNWDEEVASKCTCWMYCYARDVIKEKLPEVLHNRMIMAFGENKDDLWCKRYFDVEIYKRVRKPR